MALAIRLAKPGDLDAIAELHATSWRSTYRGVFSETYLGGDIRRERQAHWFTRLIQEGMAWINAHGSFDRWHLWVVEANGPARRIYGHLGRVPGDRAIHLAPDGTEYPVCGYTHSLN